MPGPCSILPSCQSTLPVYTGYADGAWSGPPRQTLQQSASSSSSSSSALSSSSSSSPVISLLLCPLSLCLRGPRAPRPTVGPPPPPPDRVPLSLSRSVPLSLAGRLARRPDDPLSPLCPPPSPFPSFGSTVTGVALLLRTVIRMYTYARRTLLEDFSGCPSCFATQTSSRPLERLRYFAARAEDRSRGFLAAICGRSFRAPDRHSVPIAAASETARPVESNARSFTPRKFFARPRRE